MLPPDWLSPDRMVSCLLLPLGVWILFNGLDDLIVDLAGLLAFVAGRFKKQPSRRDLLREPEKNMAVFVPCWHESVVIADMVESNRERISYRSIHFFIGAYPNDESTIAVVSGLEQRFENVHLALCPHDGPTSKADCLNWIYQRMLLYETAREAHFDVIVTHDAEDVIHPESMLWINWHMRDHDMVQIPVLPLPTPITLWTHGIYIDEFSEYQCRDMPARQFMGAFVPSNGVGTGFRREALDELAASQGNRIFEPVCLTEDYENGLRLKLRGAKQLFLQIKDHSVATREYFPQTFATAVKQRTRWVTGISLQTWERYGWSGKLVDKYWLWRDRKGLIGNPASLLTNILFAWGAVCGAMENFAGWHSQFYARTLELAPLFAVTSVVGVYRMLFRGYAVGRRFGWKFAIGVPVRVVVANCINAQATIRAFARYASARLKGEPLVWVKTEHQYPTAASLIRERRLIGEILVMNGYIEEFQLRAALLTKPPDRRLGEHLIDLGVLNEDDLYEALSLQHHLPNTRVEPSDVRLGVARSLPAHVARLWGVVPFGVEDGKLLLAGAELPSPGLEPALKHFTRLEIRFYLMSSSRLHILAETLL